MITYKSILTTLFFTFFLYSSYLKLDSYIINTIFALMGFYALFMLTKKELFATGFLISIFWFWWIAYSFIYYELEYLIPLILLGVGLLYGTLFYVVGLFTNIYLKIIYIFTLSFVNPFGFNWFKLELLFINSYLGTSKIEFLLILIVLGLFYQYRNKYTFKSNYGLGFVLILLCIYNNLTKIEIEKPNIKIMKYQTHIDQNKKWNKFFRQEIIENNFKAIKQAIDMGKDLIIMPETAFPLVLNKEELIHNRLLELSKYISIVTGSLYLKDGLYYNSTYLYQNEKVKVAHKVVLVPFGEAVPLPEKIRNIINDVFYNGAKDYETAQFPTTFEIKGIKFRNAICYEATTNDIFENLDTPYIIATSNNAWFSPSIQPTLQNLLMKYYSKKYNLYYINVSNE